MVYKVCGYTILACIGLIVVCEGFFLNSWSLFPGTEVGNYGLVLWLEAIAIASFGFSWLTKGEVILADD